MFANFDNVYFQAPSPSVVRANNLRAREAAAELSRRIGLADKDKKEDSVEGDAEKKEEKTGQGGNDTGVFYKSLIGSLA